MNRQSKQLAVLPSSLQPQQRLSHSTLPREYLSSPTSAAADCLRRNSGGSSTQETKNEVNFTIFSQLGNIDY